MTTLPLSILEGMLNDRKLDEITYESMAQEMMEEMENDRKAEVEAEPETKQEVERTTPPEKCGTKRARPDNQKKAIKNRKPSSQKSK